MIYKTEKKSKLNNKYNVLVKLIPIRIDGTS